MALLREQHSVNKEWCECVLKWFNREESKEWSKAKQCKDEGNKCIKEGKHTEAIFHYTEAIRHEPNSAILYSNRALAFLKIDQLYLAMEDAQKAIKLEPSWPKGFYRKGEIEFKAGHYSKALLSYKQALTLDPADDGIIAAISKTNKEIAKDKKDAVRKPLVYTCLGFAVGIFIVAADQFIAVKPSIPHSILQVLLVLSCGGVGFMISKVHRYLVVSQRESLLEEPIDLLKEMDNRSKSSDTISSSVPSDKSKPFKRKTQKGKA